MYQIIKDGEVIALVERLHFIRQSDNGSFVQTNEENARGVAVAGTPYNLLGREEMEGTAGIVGYSEVNGGEVVFKNNHAITSLDKLVVEQEYRLTLLDLGLGVL